MKISKLKLSNKILAITVDVAYINYVEYANNTLYVTRYVITSSSCCLEHKINLNDNCDHLSNLQYYGINSGSGGELHILSFTTDRYIYIIEYTNTPVINKYNLLQSYKFLDINRLCIKNNDYYIVFNELTPYRINTTEDISFIHYIDNNWVYGIKYDEAEDMSTFDYLLYFNHLKRFYNTFYLNRLLDINYKYNINHILKYY